MRTYQHGLRLAERFARQDACVFQRHGISLLRHDAAGLHVSVAQSQKVKFLRAPQEQVLHQLAQAHHQHGDRSSRFAHIISRRDRSVGILLQTIEPQQPRRVVAANRKTSRGDGAGTQWTAVDRGERRAQPLPVPPQRFDGAEQVMRQRRRLRRLRMRVGRHHRIGVCLGQFHQHLPALRCFLCDSQHLEPQLHSVKRQVNVVSTARRMHLSRGILAAHLNQQILYVEKQVLASAVVTSRKDRPAVQPFDRGQTHARVAFGDNALPAQHQRVRRVNFEKRSEKMLLGVLKVHCQHGFGINRGGKSFGSKGRR